METKVYSLFDLKAAVYGTPFFMPNDGMAIRALIDLVSERGSMVGKHPEDFTLYRLGNFEDNGGIFNCDVHPTWVMSCSKIVSDAKEAYELAGKGPAQKFEQLELPVVANGVR